MSLNELEANGRLRRHETSAQEVADLMRIAEAGLADARVEAVTLDRRFCAAYDAARALADLVLACAGYRTMGAGRHVTVFEALPMAMGEERAELSGYLSICRARRNVAEYERVGEIMADEVSELIECVEAFRGEVLEWLRERHPSLQPPTE